MIRSKTAVDAQAMERQLAFLRQVPEILTEVVLDVGAEYEPLIVADLGQVPGPVQYPIEWASEKQRRYVLGFVLEHDEKGNIIPYQRKGKAGMGWRVDISQQGRVVFLAVQNTWSAARYVFGNLIGSPAGDQQPFHRNTGWQYAAPKLTDWFKRVDDEIYKRYRTAVKEARRK